MLSNLQSEHFSSQGSTKTKRAEKQIQHYKKMIDIKDAKKVSRIFDDRAVKELEKMIQEMLNMKKLN